MPRVHFVKKARKDNPAVKAGESYYWWKFRYGGKRYSATPPKQSQLTQSAYFGALYDLTDQIDEWEGEADDFESFKEEVAEALGELRDEQQEKIDNMASYNLEYSPTGEMIQERLDACEAAVDEIECIDDFEFDDDEFDEDEPRPEDYDEDDDYDDDYTDWEQRKADYEDGEEDRRNEAFNEWIGDAKSQMSDAVSNAIV